VGLKPTYGRVSRYGVFALAASMDHVGPMTRTVEDAAIMFEAIAGPDPHDPTSLPEPVPLVTAELGRGIAGLRVGFDRRYATDNVDPDVATAMDDVLADLTRLGATVVTVTMPDVSKVSNAWLDLCAVEALTANCEDVPEPGQRVRSGVSRCARVSNGILDRGGLAHVHMEPTRRSSRPIMSPRRAAHLTRYAADCRTRTFENDWGHRLM
jgi:Asp-tRNA(Asn)/Glu-tRNA(Gln) amidotransferase A subunit family amidase